MAGTPSGFLGKLAAQRPFLTTGVLALGMTALSIVGVRQSGDLANAPLISRFILYACYALGLPFILNAMTHFRLAPRLVFILIVMLAAYGVVLAAKSASPLPFGVTMPDPILTITAAGLFIFLQFLSPFFGNVARLSVIAPFAAALGVAGAAGFLAFDGLLTTQSGAAAASIALAVGVAIGAGVSADYANYFVKGAQQEPAAAAAGYSALAPAAFSILTAGAYFIVRSFIDNFGAVNWPVLQGGLIASLLAVATAMMTGAGAMALSGSGEETALNENRRRQWFASAWRPIRIALPVTSALAATAIVGVVLVIAAFEAGVTAPVSLLSFLGVVWIAAIVTFVSLRTSILIVAILFASSLLGEYALSIAGFEAPALGERLAALTLTAVALAQLTASWRDAGGVWRNARDVAQHAMSDGLRRYLLTMGAGAASLITAGAGLGWAGSISAAAFFILTCVLGLIISPAMMIAMSARTRNF